MNNQARTEAGAGRPDAIVFAAHARPSRHGACPARPLRSSGDLEAEALLR